MAGPTEKPRRRRGRKGDSGKGKEARDDKSLKPGDSVKSYKPHNSCLVDLEGESWHDVASGIKGCDDTIYTDPPSDSRDSNSRAMVEKYRSLANEIYKTELQVAAHGSNTKRGSDEQWVENTMKRGTLKDRIAATTVVVSTDPVHKLHALDSLLQMAGCSDAGQTNSRVAQMSAEALEDLFLNNLLPSHRKLFGLEQRPLYRYETDAKKTLSPRILLLWRYEEMIKEKFHLFLNRYLVATLKDGMELSKIIALRTAGSLLRSVPEGESQLLNMMVNKLGDPGKKIASAAGHELRRVLEQHRNMQIVVAREVQQLAHRPNLSPRALYNCITFLNQLKLTRDDVGQSSAEEKRKGKSSAVASLPASLISTYFRLFEVAVKQLDEGASGMKSRLLSALLTGVNRAHPFLPEQDKDLEEHMDALFRVVHSAPPAASTQALMLLFHVAVGSPVEGDSRPTKKKDGPQQDRFYRALYAKLAQPNMVSTGRHATMFFNLLYKAMKYDDDEVRVMANAKRLLCTVTHANPPVIAAALFLLNEIMKSHQSLLSGASEIGTESENQLLLEPSKRDPRSAFVQGYGQRAVPADKESFQKVPLWEEALLSCHYHPSVAKFASTISEITYDGDPLRDFGLAPFLDRFAYRNPKKRQQSGDSGKRKSNVAERRSGVRVDDSLPVNDPSFLKKRDVAEHEEFYRKFFEERTRRDEIKGIVRNKPGEESDQDDEDQAFEMMEEAGDVERKLDEGWNTDSEEEEFVNKLAMDLMEKSQNGQVDFDDEDPDMEGWDDMYSDDEDSPEGKEDDEIVESSDDSTNEEDDDGVAGRQEKTVSKDGDDFMDASEDSSDDEEASEDVPPFEADDDDSEDGGLMFLGDEEDDEISDDDETPQKNVKKRKQSEPVFADASEYEEMINKSWDDLRGGKVDKRAGKKRPKRKR